jgi:hypothetical protein
VIDAMAKQLPTANVHNGKVVFVLIVLPFVILRGDVHHLQFEGYLPADALSITYGAFRHIEAWRTARAGECANRFRHTARSGTEAPNRWWRNIGPNCYRAQN